MSGRWHHDGAGRERTARVVRDLVCGEAALLRPGAAPWWPALWTPSLRLDEQGVGLDSLERLSVAGALAELLHLHESGLEDLLLARRTWGEWLEVCAASLARHDARLTFRTSGSSGQPRPCTHVLSGLEREIAHTAGLLGGVRRIVSAVPSHHIYGFLFTVLLPQRLGDDVELVDARLQTPSSLVSQLRAGDLVVSHPAHWALLARHAPPFPDGVQGVSSTAPCPDALADALVGRGLQRLLQVYGSSETAGIGWRWSAHEPYTLMPWWQRSGDAAIAADDVGALALPDELAWHDERRFDVRGRRDAAVQVAGINVYPQQVRSLLCTHADVADAAVRPMRAEEGGRLKAFVVPRRPLDEAALAAALTELVQQRLPAPARPRSFAFGPALPVDARGKACDWALARSTEAQG